MQRDEAEKLISKFITEVRSAALARKGSAKQRDHILGMAMYRAEILEQLIKEQEGENS